jgi:hypothetical protein
MFDRQVMPARPREVAMTGTLKGKTMFISGGSRGIGSRSPCEPPATAPTSR